MSKYAPTPWKVYDEQILETHIADSSGFYVVKAWDGHERARANAQRIVACVNAMEGIEDVAAARIILDEPATQYAQDLLLGCKGALTALILAHHVDKQQAIDYLKEVLAKVEGKH